MTGPRPDAPPGPAGGRPVPDADPGPAARAAVRAGVLELADLVAEALARANHAAVAVDLDVAQTVVQADEAVDDLALQLEQQADARLRVAGDSREVDDLVAALQLVTEIEQAGDVAVDVARIARRLYRSSRSPRLTGLVERAGEEALALFHVAVAAYADDGHDPAEACAHMEGRLEDLSTSFVQTVLDASDAAERPDLQVCVQVALLGRAYERIGHHATTIAEWAYFRVHGSAPPPIATASFARRTRAQVLRPPAGPAAVEIPPPPPPPPPSPPA